MSDNAARAEAWLDSGAIDDALRECIHGHYWKGCFPCSQQIREAILPSLTALLDEREKEHDEMCATERFRLRQRVKDHDSARQSHQERANYAGARVRELEKALRRWYDCWHQGSNPTLGVMAQVEEALGGIPDDYEPTTEGSAATPETISPKLPERQSATTPTQAERWATAPRHEPYAAPQEKAGLCRTFDPGHPYLCRKRGREKYEHPTPEGEEGRR